MSLIGSTIERLNSAREALIEAGVDSSCWSDGIPADEEVANLMIEYQAAKLALKSAMKIAVQRKASE